jgi:subtilisin family serine protease
VALSARRRRRPRRVCASLLAAGIALLTCTTGSALAAARQVFPNDPFFSSQWDLFNTGQTIVGTAGTTGLDAHLPEAWTVTTGSPSVKVAVVDTGIDWRLPDLARNVDVADGANFDSPGAPPMDTVGHGTAMAGIIGAVGNNGVGIAGVNWRVSLIAEKVPLAQEGKPPPPPVVGGEQKLAAAITDAVSKGARVVNLSFGGDQPQPALDQAMAAAPNTLFVIAAGNSGRNLDVAPQYPCAASPGSPAVPNKLCVAAVDNTGSLDFASNYSARLVDLAAPGTDVPQLDLPGDHSVLSNGHGYGYGSGTSQATAFVSGVAALVLAHDPNLDGAALRARILATVDRVPSLAGKVASGGEIDAGGALGVAPGPRPRRDGPDRLIGRSAQALVHAPPTSRCLARPLLVLRIRGANGISVETVTITVGHKRGKPIYPPQNERPIAVTLGAGRRVTVSITIADTSYRPYYLTLRYRRC